MKKAVVAIGVLLAVGLGLLGLGFTPARVAPADGAGLVIPDFPRVAGVRLAAIPAGSMSASQGMAFRGGDPLQTVPFAMGAIYVEHPAGRLLFDTGLGREAMDHLATTPWLMRASAQLTLPERTVAEQLREAGIDTRHNFTVVLTHAHWDHVSGLADLGEVAVIASPEEVAHIESEAEDSALARSFLPGVRYIPFNYRHGPYLGFPASFDVFGDGSVVMVPAPGHTPGSTIAFIHTEDGRHYALIGDIAWQREGVALPAERPWLVRRMLREDEAQVRAQLGFLHTLQQRLPELTVVPAHDATVWAQLPRLGG